MRLKDLYMIYLNPDLPDGVLPAGAAGDAGEPPTRDVDAITRSIVSDLDSDTPPTAPEPEADDVLHFGDADEGDGSGEGDEGGEDTAPVIEETAKEPEATGYIKIGDKEFLSREEAEEYVANWQSTQSDSFRKTNEKLQQQDAELQRFRTQAQQPQVSPEQIVQDTMENLTKLGYEQDRLSGMSPEQREAHFAAENSEARLQGYDQQINALRQENQQIQQRFREQESEKLYRRELDAIDVEVKKLATKKAPELNDPKFQPLRDYLTATSLTSYRYNAEGGGFTRQESVEAVYDKVFGPISAIIESRNKQAVEQAKKNRTGASVGSAASGPGAPPESEQDIDLRDRDAVTQAVLRDLQRQ